MQGDNFEIFAFLLALHGCACLATVKKEEKNSKKKCNLSHMRGGGAFAVALSYTTDIVWTPQV